jgi:hypothetical protein
MMRFIPSLGDAVTESHPVEQALSEAHHTDPLPGSATSGPLAETSAPTARQGIPVTLSRRDAISKPNSRPTPNAAAQLPPNLPPSPARNKSLHIASTGNGSSDYRESVEIRRRRYHPAFPGTSRAPPNLAFIWFSCTVVHSIAQSFTGGVVWGIAPIGN